MIELRRETDPRWLNWLCNHPKVRPTLGGPPTPIDLSAILEDGDNVALRGEHGAMIFVQLQPGLYELHTQVLPRGRGAWTLELTFTALHTMFCGTPMVEVVTRVPDGNIAAKAAIRAAGRVLPIMQFMHRADGWLDGTTFGGATFYSLKIQDWLVTAPGLPEAGDRFHEECEAAYERAGRELKEAEGHREDREHARYAGAAYEMIRFGQTQKACAFYNRFASLTRHPAINLLSLDPLRLHLGDVAVEVNIDRQTFDLVEAH